MKYRLLSIAFILVSAVLAVAQAPRGLQPEDLYLIKDVTDAQISPEGSRVAFTVSEATPDRSRSVSQLWIVPTSGGEPKRLIAGEGSTPRWSPDGRMIAFYAARDGQNGLWVVSAEGGEAQMLTPVRRTNFFLTHAGESFAWSPDSRRIAFLSAPENPSDVASASASGSLGDINERLRRPLTRAEIEMLPPAVRDRILQAQGQSTTSAPSAPPSAPAVPSPPDDPRVITRLQYKSRTAFSDQLPLHILTVEVDTRQTRQITFGRHYEHSINWSPRGDEIVFVSNHESDPDAVNNTDIFAVNIESRSTRQLTHTKGCEWTPVFSPDGSEIAYTATQRPITTIDSVAEDSHVYVVPSQGGAPRNLNRAQDRRAGLVRWSRDKTVLFTAGDQGKTLIYRAGQSVEVSSLFDRAAQVSSFTVAPTGNIALTLSDATHPAEVHLLTAAGELKQLSAVNRELLATRAFSEPREFKFKNEDFDVQGWLVPPMALDESKKYPVVLSIHGGPHGMHGYGFNATARVMAARGYAVLLINPRGSSGYGQKFSDGCVNDWGGGDYRDLMKGVDEALARFRFLDPQRMGVMGGSYGGYMTNWVVTQTDRFKAAVTSASLSNLISFYSTSLYQDLIHAEFNGHPWEGNNFEKLWERSPLKYIKQAKTPLMLIHGEQDNDVHITQAEEMYTALRMRGVEAALVRYPREGHGFREPRHRYDQLVRTLDWFGQRLR